MPAVVAVVLRPREIMKAQQVKERGRVVVAAVAVIIVNAGSLRP